MSRKRRTETRAETQGRFGRKGAAGWTEPERTTDNFPNNGSHDMNKKPENGNSNGLENTPCGDAEIPRAQEDQRKERKERKMKEIEKVSRGSPIGINSPIRKRRVTYLVTIQYRDGTERTVWLVSKCVGFLRDGFLSKKGRDWLFHDSDGKLAATRPAKEIGQCEEIGVCAGREDGFYLFQRPDGIPLPLDAKGNELALPAGPIFGAGHAWFRSDGFTAVAEKLRKALAEDSAAAGNPHQEESNGSGE